MEVTSVEPSLCGHVSQLADFSLDDIISRNCCQMCGSNGPNLWVCVTDCCDLFTGCGEGKSDHSTQHFQLNRNHRLTLNSTTFRIWCYECQTEIIIDNIESEQLSCSQSVTSINEDRSKPILSNQVYVADITDEETTDEEEVLIGLFLSF